jgi:predicted nucleic acid-binding protein
MQLIDTNILSQLMRKQPNQGVLGWLELRQKTSPRLTISAITMDEIA